MNPLISIIMPAYNAAAYIASSIISVQEQTYTNWELIVVDDGSSDNTAEIVRKFQQADTRIIYIHQENKRLGAARNTALRAASGEYVAYLDSDDLWVPEKLFKQLTVFRTQKVDVVFSDGYMLMEETKLTEPYPTISGFFTGEQMYQIEYTGNFIAVLSVLVKKEWIDSIGFQEESLYFFGCEDWDYWLRLSRAGADFYGMTDKLFYYRRHSSNMSGDTVKMRLAQAAVFFKNYDRSAFTKQQATGIFRPLLNPLLNDLIRMDKIQEARFVVKGIYDIQPSASYWFKRYFLRLPHPVAIFGNRVLDKLERIFA